MSDKLARRGRGSDLAAWRPAGARLEPGLFRQGLALIAAGQGKALEPETVQAYWLALAGVDPADFRDGVRLALQRERFITPAAVFEACQEVSQSRASVAAREHWEAERRRDAVEREERHRAFVTRDAALRAEAAAWTTPPVDVEELRARVLVLLELRRQPSALYLVRRAEVSGTVSEPVLVVEHGAFFRRAAGLVSDVATEAAGHPVRVTVTAGPGGEAA